MSFYQSGNKQCFIFFISACIICSTVTAAVAGINAHQRTVIDFFLVIRFIICRLCLLFLFCHTADRFSGKSHCTDCTNHTGHHYSRSFQPVPFSFFYSFHPNTPFSSVFIFHGFTAKVNHFLIVSLSSECTWIKSLP